MFWLFLLSFTPWTFFGTSFALVYFQQLLSIFGKFEREMLAKTKARRI